MSHAFPVNVDCLIFSFLIPDVHVHMTNLSQSRCPADEDERLWLTPMIHSQLWVGDKYLSGHVSGELPANLIYIWQYLCHRLGRTLILWLEAVIKLLWSGYHPYHKDNGTQKKPSHPAGLWLANQTNPDSSWIPTQVEIAHLWPDRNVHMQTHSCDTLRHQCLLFWSQYN